MIGRLDPQKGFDLLVDAAPRLLAAGARLIVQDLGADYLFTIKTNQATLHETVHRLLSAGAFSPSGTEIENERPTPGAQPQPAGMPPVADAAHDPGTDLFCGRRSNR